MIGRMAFCNECRRDVEYKEVNVNLESRINGYAYQYGGIKAVCLKCGSDVYVQDIEAYNHKALNEVFRQKNGIISLDKILELPDKYKIEKRTLSLMLGWGENTFSRFCDGEMPTKQCSDILHRLYYEPEYFESIYMANLDKIDYGFAYASRQQPSEYYHGGRIAISDNSMNYKNDTVVECENESKIERVAMYVISKYGDITPLMLQKVLYYVQGFYFAFMGEYFFIDDCEAWINGPGYEDVYQQFINYRFNPEEGNAECDVSSFTEYERAVMDSVIKYLCCYSGNMLERFTCSEMPWLVTRKDLTLTTASKRVIEKKLIKEYFGAVKEKYKMLQPTDIENYANEMFDKNKY